MEIIPNLNVVYLARILIGFNGVTWTMLAPLVMNEVVPPKYKSFFSNVFYVFLTGAIVVGYSFGGEFAKNHWRICFLIPAFFDGIKLILFLIIFKQITPQELIDQHGDELDEENLRLKLVDSYEFQYTNE